MPLTNTPERWGHLSIALHWFTALLVIGLLLIGFFMDELPNTPLKRDVFIWHKSFGLTVFALTAMRIGWRLAQPTPSLPADMPAWERFAAKLGHAGLYLLLLGMPASGALMNWASNFPTPLFGMTLIERAGQVDRALKSLGHELHEWGGWALLALLLVHAGAALWHHHHRRDGVLARMAPWLTR